MTRVRVQQEAFDPGNELNTFLACAPHAGGVATFIGQMRDFRGPRRQDGETVSAMTLEHYPGMAQKELENIVAEALRRWPLDDALVIHRFGTLHPGDAIVLVAAASAHRADALDACAFLIDWLKTKAPFWKKETTAQGPSWVDAADTDDQRTARWNERR